MFLISHFTSNASRHKSSQSLRCNKLLRISPSDFIFTFLTNCSSCLSIPLLIFVSAHSNCHAARLVSLQNILGNKLQWTTSLCLLSTFIILRPVLWGNSLPWYTYLKKDIEKVAGIDMCVLAALVVVVQVFCTTNSKTTLQSTTDLLYRVWKYSWTRPRCLVIRVKLWILPHVCFLP